MSIYSYEVDEKEFMAIPENRENREKSLKEKRASLRFYQNSMTGRDALKNPMYKIPGAYGLINALLFDGITSEKTRVREGKSLHPELLDHMSSLYNAVRDIFYFFSASVAQGKCPALTLYRTERAAGLEAMIRSGRTISLTSASRVCEFPDYLLEKEGICLLRFQVPAFAPRIDVNAILTEGNCHPEEQEVILPPFLELEISRQEELFQGRIPVYSVEVKGPDGEGKLRKGETFLAEKKKLCGKAVLERCGAALRAIENHLEPSPEDLDAYLEWKKLFRETVRTWSLEAENAAGICRCAEKIRTETERQMERGLMTREEALRIRTENAEKIQNISGLYIGDLISLTDRILELSGLEKEYYDYYPADLGHPEYGPGAYTSFIYFKDLPDFSEGVPSEGETIRFAVKTADGGTPVWMDVEMTVEKKTGEKIRGKIRIPGYTGKGDLYVDMPGKELLIFDHLYENREDPVWKTKRKEPDRLFRLRLQ